MIQSDKRGSVTHNSFQFEEDEINVPLTLSVFRDKPTVSTFYVFTRYSDNNMEDRLRREKKEGRDAEDGQL